MSSKKKQPDGGGIVLFQAVQDAVELHTCPTCGQPTSLEDECSFCRTWDRVRKRLHVTTGQRAPQPAR